MDPNVNLLEQRRLSNELLNGIVDGVATGKLMIKAERLAELVLALDTWITNGGFKPREWIR